MTDTMQGVGAGPETASLPGGVTVPGATACRHCGAPLELTVVDLGKSPLCQTVLTVEQLEQAEAFYPLHVCAANGAGSSRSREFVPPEDIFTEYAYFSAYSDSGWSTLAVTSEMTRTTRPRTGRASSSSSPRTMAISFSTSCRRGFRCSASSRR